MKASNIIAWLKLKVGNGYVYGATGCSCTIEFLKQKQSQYGSLMGEGYYQKNGDYTKGRCAKWIGKWVFDCSGLIKSARQTLTGVWKDVSAQGTYDQCTKRGAIKTMPLVPGCSVYMWSSSKKRMGHVGMYIGSGQVIEARGVNYGVVITKLSDRAWTHWGLLDWLEYDLPADTGKAVVGSQADAGDATTSKPDDKPTAQEVVEFAHGKILDDEAKWLKKALSDNDVYCLLLNFKNHEERKG